MRLRFDISYDGTEFSGWAEQPGRRTVAGVIAAALATVLRLDPPPRLTVAGRTDAGVHASGQVAHVDLDDVEDLPLLLRRLAGVLPADVAIKQITEVTPDFDARFSALARHYRYLLTDGILDPLRRRDTVAWPRPLDVAAMHEAAQPLVGAHDFAAFCKWREGASTMRTLLRLDVTRTEQHIVIAASGEAFCHNQVRSMVGAIIAVGEGRREIAWPHQVLAAAVRDSAVNVAPARGLTLIRVDYPDPSPQR